MASESKRFDMLIIIPPAGDKNTIYPPYGAMYIASALREKGYNPFIIDCDGERVPDAELVRKVQVMNPRYIGFSGIVAPSYQYIKKISFDIRAALPNTVQILGGGLSSAADAILRYTSVDIVVLGEGDRTIIDLLKCLDEKGDLSNVQGISYKKDSAYLSTARRPIIANLDTLPYPAFDLVDMEKYIPDAVDFIRFLSKEIVDIKQFADRKKRRMMTIPTSRGCFNECSFCFRAYAGLRVHSIKYVFDFMEYCVKKFDIGFFSFGDECFAPNIKRNWEFINEFKRRKLDTPFRILGMRVDTVDKDILMAYKEIGCWMIEYGFESGSQKMLNVINKRVTVEQNRNAAIWTNDAGIYTSPALVLAMPGETDETIDESIEFLKSLNFNFKQYQWKYAIPIPGSQLYEFAKLSGAIENEDEYLISLKGGAATGAFNTNLTDEPDEVVASWEAKLKSALDQHYFYQKYKVKNRFLSTMIRYWKAIALYYRQGILFYHLKKKLREIIAPVPAIAKPAKSPVNRSMFRKKKDVCMEQLICGQDVTRVNRDMSLHAVNKKLRQKASDSSVVSK